jgi:DNA polymerase-3 subunit epsilon
MTKKINYVLGIDLEGMHSNLVEEGIDHTRDRITEIGAVLWDCNEMQPVQILSELIDEEDRLPISAEIQDLTGISENMLKNFGHKRTEIPSVIEKLKMLIDKADACMAHNGDNYDHPMLKEFFKRYKSELPEKVWLDTSKHVEYPRKVQGLSMMALEHSHGFINPFPHRAVTDVLAMLKIASNYNFDRIYQLATSSRVQLIAVLDAPNWRNQKEVQEFNKIKNKVAKSKFRWHADIKKWIKEVPKILLDEGKIQYDFDYYMKEL